MHGYSFILESFSLLLLFEYVLKTKGLSYSFYIAKEYVVLFNITHVALFSLRNIFFRLIGVFNIVLSVALPIWFFL